MDDSRQHWLTTQDACFAIAKEQSRPRQARRSLVVRTSYVSEIGTDARIEAIAVA